ncbi:hypothetical protein ACFQS7_26585 [Dankookia sp. GCM10030260]|uniref:hypothetical protein n=1 Tax=Dankookia sp. GCM10030260 TaxID=3273390 RepID=UPI003613C7E9
MAFGTFVFDMRGALWQQVVAELRGLDWRPLTQANVDDAIQGDEARAAQGVYVLARLLDPALLAVAAPWAGDPDDVTDNPDGSQIRPVYVGQSQSSLHERLSRHADFIDERNGLAPGQVLFKALSIPTFSSVSIESILAGHFMTAWNDADPTSGWRLSGFGSNDTGGRRDQQEISNFDLRFPINPFAAAPRSLALAMRRIPTIQQRVRALRRSCPYTVRVASRVSGDPALQARPNLPAVAADVFDGCEIILDALGGDWVAEVSPVRIVFNRIPPADRGGMPVLTRAGGWPLAHPPWSGIILPP